MRILIIGAGDIGFHLGKHLCAENHDVTMIDSDARKVHRVQEQLDAFVLEGSGSSFRQLQEAGIEQMEVVAALSNNDEVNLLACRLAKKVGVPLTLARVRNPEFTEPDFILSLTELGVDHIIHPELEIAVAVSQLVNQSSATYIVEFEGGKIQVLGVRLDRNSPLIDTPLINVTGYADEHLRIVAVDRNHRTLIPDGTTVLEQGDKVFAVCEQDYVSDFLRLAGKRDKPVSNAIIFGGGLVSRYIAERVEHKMNIKIIESDEEKAHKLACVLPNTLVIHGDGTDLELLKSEGLDDMDAFIAVTGNDENNIISSLTALHLDVPQVIAQINKVEYLSVTPTIGLDTVVSKQLLTVNAVRHLIQREITDIASPPGMDAQLVEFVANSQSKITRKPLRKIKFPRNAIIGAIIRGEDVIIPHGETQVQPGDKMIVFTLPEAMLKVDRLIGK